MLSWLEEHLQKLNLVETMIQEDGFTRLGYSDLEWKSMEVFTTIAEQLGLHVRQDEAGNRIARWESVAEESKSLPAVAVGSHVDTVTHGGGYDGVAGVLCALGAIKKLKEKNFTPTYPVEVICFASEESSRFGISTIGSKAMAGTLSPEKIGHVKDEQGVSIKEAVEQQGLEWEKVTLAERDRDALKSFLELHIEQGVRIENAGANFGAVTAIACPIRLKIKVQGQTGHTGTTPMKNRRDAFVAIAPLVSMISEKGQELSERSAYPVVATTSTINLEPNSMTSIPGLVELGIDIRSVDDSLKEQMVALIKEKCIELEEKFCVNIEISTLVNNPSVKLDEALLEKVKQYGESIGYKSFVMESGAGHDVMNMAKKWPSGLIFIPCRDGLSHHPNEYASLEDLHMGVEILSEYISREASKSK